MLLGTLYFLFSQRYLGDAGLPPTDVPAAERKRTWTLLIGIAVAAAVLAVVLFAREHPPTETAARARAVRRCRSRSPWSSSATCCSSADSTRPRRRSIGVIIVFFFCAVLFWGGFEQQGTTFNTFAFDYTDRSLGGTCSRTANIRPRGTSR